MSQVRHDRGGYRCEYWILFANGRVQRWPFGPRNFFRTKPAELSEHLGQTIRNNGIQNISLEQAGVADETGWAELFVPKRPGNNTATMVANDGGRPVRVSIVTLDEYMEQHQIARVDFLKIDVEGFEPKIIRGARIAIQAKRIRAVFCEFNGEWLRKSGTTPKGYHRDNELRSLGFKPMEEPTEASLEERNVLFVAD